MLGQAPFIIHSSTENGSFFGPVMPLMVWSFVYLAAQFVVVCRVLTRSDFDTQNKILWLLVTMFVPLGLLIYLFKAPAVVPTVGSPRRATPASDVSGTPWSDNPGYSRRT